MAHSRRRSNCFVFAVWMYWTRGGYLVVRPSRHIVGWHWLWSPDLIRFLHYSPLAPQPMPRAMWHKLWFRGRIVRGDLPIEWVGGRRQRDYIIHRQRHRCVRCAEPARSGD